MSTVLQTDIPTRATTNVLTTMRERERVYAQIFNNTGRKTDPLRYVFRLDAQGRMVRVINNPDHVAFLLVSGNFYPCADQSTARGDGEPDYVVPARAAYGGV